MGTRLTNNGLAAVLVLGLLAGCGNIGSKDKEGTKRTSANESAGVRLAGIFSLLDGRQADLANLDASKPSIVYFVSDTCTVCAAETDELVSHFGGKRAPESANIVSIVVGATDRDAQDWSDEHAVGWTVGYQTPSENASLLRKYCPAIQTPCVLVSVPDKGVVLAKNGRTGAAELAKYVGDIK